MFFKKSKKKAKSNLIAEKNYTCQTKKLKLPKYKLSTNSDASIHSSSNESTYVAYKCQYFELLHYCIFKKEKKYHNFIAMINPNLSHFIPTLGNNFSLLINPENDTLNYLNYTRKNFVKELHRLSTLKKFIIINCGPESHANVIVYDTRDYSELKAYYFEPHGQLYNNHLTESIKNKIESVILDSQKGLVKKPSIAMYWPKNFLPLRGYQLLDIMDQNNKSIKQTDIDGYCMYWCFYFVNMVIKFPKIRIERLVEQNFEQISKHRNSKKSKINFHSHIRNYSQRLEKRTEKVYKHLNKFKAEKNGYFSTQFKNLKDITNEYIRVFKYHDKIPKKKSIFK